MKRILTAVFAAALLLPAVAQETETAREAGVIDVIGEAEAKLRPDYASISVMVGKQGEEPDKIQQSVMTSVSDVLDYLKGHKAVKNVRTQHVRLDPRHSYDSDERSFMARQVISFDLVQLDAYDEVMYKLLEKDINGIHGVDFKSSAEEKHRQRLLQEAVMNAREKASMLAEQAGRSVGKAIFITDRPSGGPQPFPGAGYDALRVKSSSSSVEPGEIVLTEIVNVRFQLN